MTTVIQNAAKFWAEDLVQVEGRYLHGRDICDLPASEGDDRVPNQGTVLVYSTININDIVGRPTLFESVAATFMKIRRRMFE